MGVQVQVVGHFGRQDHVEFNLPATLRYSPPRGWLRSSAFALELSYTTKLPQVEIDRSGNSQRTFFYWMAETEFDLATPEDIIFLRMHHRSDGNGVF